MSYDEDGNRQRKPHGLSKAEIRKCNKPIMEKRRRARINNCLDELKSLILEAMKKDPSRHTKLEKADILELTVRHLQDIQTKPSILTKFSSGFSDCAEEVVRYVSEMDEIDIGIKQRLTRHLNSCITNMTPGIGSVYTKLFDDLRPPTLPLPDFNNNHLQAVRLSSGELALLLNSPQIPSSFYQPELSSFDLSIPHVSAFNVVRGPVSPPLSPNSTSNYSDMTPKNKSSTNNLEKFPTPPDDKADKQIEGFKMSMQQSSQISSSTSFIKEEPSDKMQSDDEDFLVTKRAKIEAPPEPAGENVWRPW